MASRSTTGSVKAPTKTKTSTATTPAAAAKTPAKPELEVVTEKTAAELVAPMLKKRELLQLVAERADMQNNKVKPVLEAMLEVLGEALAEGRELNLQPFGRLKINRQKEAGSARITIAKIRQSRPSDDDAAA